MKARLDSPEKEKFDSFVVNVEFLLISVIQGGALATLGVAAAPILSTFEFSYIPYVLSALVFILVFWAQAIVHTLSFIEWPIDITHNLLYFLIGLVEIMAFLELKDPLRWFGFIFVFFVIAAILYMYDLRLIRRQEKKFEDSEERKKLYRDILKRQIFELKVFVPMALIYNAVCFLLILSYPTIFITQNYQLILITIQLIFGVVVMAESLQGFKTRIRLVSSTIK